MIFISPKGFEYLLNYPSISVEEYLVAKGIEGKHLVKALETNEILLKLFSAQEKLKQVNLGLSGDHDPLIKYTKLVKESSSQKDKDKDFFSIPRKNKKFQTHLDSIQGSYIEISKAVKDGMPEISSLSESLMQHLDPLERYQEALDQKRFPRDLGPPKIPLDATLDKLKEKIEIVNTLNSILVNLKTIEKKVLPGPKSKPPVVLFGMQLGTDDRDLLPELPVPYSGQQASTTIKDINDLYNLLIYLVTKLSPYANTNLHAKVDPIDTKQSAIDVKFAELHAEGLATRESFGLQSTPSSPGYSSSSPSSPSASVGPGSPNIASRPDNAPASSSASSPTVSTAPAPAIVVTPAQSASLPSVPVSNPVVQQAPTVSKPLMFARNAAKAIDKSEIFQALPIKNIVKFLTTFNPDMEKQNKEKLDLIVKTACTMLGPVIGAIIAPEMVLGIAAGTYAGKLLSKSLPEKFTSLLPNDKPIEGSELPRPVGNFFGEDIPYENVMLPMYIYYLGYETEMKNISDQMYQIDPSGPDAYDQFHKLKTKFNEMKNIHGKIISEKLTEIRARPDIKEDEMMERIMPYKTKIGDANRPLSVAINTYLDKMVAKTQDSSSTPSPSSK